MLSVVARELRVMGPAMVTALLDGPANFFEANAGNLSIETCFFCENLGKIRPIAHTRLHFRKLLKFPEGERGNRERDTWDVFVGSAPQVELQLGKLPGGFFFTRNSLIPIGPRRADFEIQCKKTC